MTTDSMIAFVRALTSTMSCYYNRCQRPITHVVVDKYEIHATCKYHLYESEYPEGKVLPIPK